MTSAGARFLAHRFTPARRQCTWVDCTNPAEHAIKTRSGAVFAHLCGQHEAELERVNKGNQTKPMLTAWARAQGFGVTARVM